MFDIGGLELLIIAVVGLLVIGPERLPETLRTLGLWLGRLRRSFVSVKSEIEKEIGMDEVRRQLHNEAIMDQMKQIERDVRGNQDTASSDHAQTNPAAEQPGTGSALKHDSTPEQQIDEHRIDAGITDADATAHTPSRVEGGASSNETASSELEPREPERLPPRSEAELEAAHRRRARNEHNT